MSAELPASDQLAAAQDDAYDAAVVAAVEAQRPIMRVEAWDDACPEGGPS
jgi:hypothetical protein